MKENTACVRSHAQSRYKITAAYHVYEYVAHRVNSAAVIASRFIALAASTNMNLTTVYRIISRYTTVIERTRLTQP